MPSSQNPIFNSALSTLKDEPQRSIFQSIQITKKQVDDYIHYLKTLDNFHRRQYIEGCGTWIIRHSSLFEDLDLDLDDICDFLDDEIAPQDERAEVVFSFSALCVWIYLDDQARQPPQEEHKAKEVDFSKIDWRDSIKFETVIDVLENMFFHDCLLFLTANRDLETLWRILLPDQLCGHGKPISQSFQEYHHRPRRQLKPIESLIQDMPTDSPEILTPLLTDGLSFTKLYGMVNGLSHQVSTSPKFSGNFVAFSFAAGFEGTSHLPQWFNNSVERSPRVLEQDMNEWNTMEWSRLFGRLLDLTENDKRWFVMRRIDRRIRVNLLADAMGFDEMRPNPEDKMTEIGQNWKCDYITLYVWRVGFGTPRVYLDFNGFRVRIRSTLDVRVILNSICRVIQIDTTDSVYDTNAKEVVNRLVASRPTAELIEGTRIARMIFLNQKNFLEAQREMEDRVVSRCFSTLSPGKANITEDTSEVSKMDDPVFDSIERVIQSRPDFIENSFKKMPNRG